MNNAQLSAQPSVSLQAPRTLPSTRWSAWWPAPPGPTQTMPNHAVIVHGELGNPPSEVVSTAGICLCGVTALKYAWLNVASGQSRNAVACGSEVPPR